MDSPSSPDSHTQMMNQSTNQSTYSTTGSSEQAMQSNTKSLLMSPIPMMLKLPDTVNSSIGKPSNESVQRSPDAQPMSVSASPMPNQVHNQSSNQGLFPPSPQGSYGSASPTLGSSMMYWGSHTGNSLSATPAGSQPMSQPFAQPLSQFSSFDSVVANAAMAASAFAHHPAIQSINQSVGRGLKHETDDQHHMPQHSPMMSMNDQGMNQFLGLPHFDLGRSAASADPLHQYSSAYRSLQPVNHPFNSPFGSSQFNTPAFAPMNPPTPHLPSQPLNQPDGPPMTPLLQAIHAMFDGARRLSPEEEQAWRSLMEQSANQSINHFARAQSEIADLRQTFDGFLSKLAHVYESHSQSFSQSSEQSSPPPIDEAQLRLHVESIAGKFCKLRAAILQSSLEQAAIIAQAQKSSNHANNILPAFEVEEEEPTSKQNKRKRSSKQRRNYFDKRSTRILKEWLNQNLDDPYPNAAVKTELAEQCGLTYDQIGHWFINSRMRIWRPMMKRGQVQNPPVQAMPVPDSNFSGSQ